MLDETVYLCALADIFAYDCITSRRLTEAMQSPADIFRLKRSDLEALLPGREAIITRLLDPRSLDRAESHLSRTAALGGRVVTINDESYPYRLRECPDAPLLLYVRGNCNLNAERVLAVVGTRHCSWYGRSVCRDMMHSFAENPIKPLIISGLAYGIDIAAQQAAYESGLETAGVMATGLDTVYPSSHSQFAERIVSQGALLTDFPPGTIGAAINFRRRNRIIAGMADATVVVESREKGGSLITAHLANSYSRDVFAVPGRLTDTSSDGTNRLIENDIARLALSASSIERRMGWEDEGRHREGRLLFRGDDDSCKRAVIKALRGGGEMGVNELCEVTGIAFRLIGGALLSLEMEGRIVSVSPNKYALM